MTPTEVITALEKALEAYAHNAGHYARDNDTVIVTALELRTLLDAHASALRTLQKIARIVIDRDANDADEVIERGLAAVGYARAALDDNTKESP